MTESDDMNLEGTFFGNVYLRMPQINFNLLVSFRAFIL